MLEYSQKTLNEILNVVRIAQSHMDVYALRKNLIFPIQQLFNSSSCTFFITDKSENLIDPVTLGLDENYLKLYQAHYCKLNPFDPNSIKYHIPQMQETQVVIDTDFIKMSEYIKTEYYNDFLKPQNIHSEMGLLLRHQGKIVGAIAVHRPKKEKKFEGNEFKIGTILGHHLAMALKNAKSYALIKKEQNFYHAISESKSTGFFILNEDLCIIHKNSKGVEICNKIQKNFSLNNDSSTFFLPPILYEVASELKKKQENKRILENTETDRYIVNLRTFDNQPNKSKNKFLLSIVELPSTNNIDNDRLKEKYTFSPREIEIFNYIHKGFKNSEIAGNLFISEGTVKSHITNIFRKTGVKNRTSLIHKVIQATCHN